MIFCILTLCVLSFFDKKNHWISELIRQFWAKNWHFWFWYFGKQVSFHIDIAYDQGGHSNQCHRAMALVTFLVSKYQKSRKSRIFLDFIIKKSRSGTGQFSLRLAPCLWFFQLLLKSIFLFRTLTPNIHISSSVLLFLLQKVSRRMPMSHLRPWVLKYGSNYNKINLF